MQMRCLSGYSNTAIRHRTWQIAMDGSQKLPQRILGTISTTICLPAGPRPGLLLAVAGWMRYVGAIDEKGEPIEVKDPLAERLRAFSGQAETPEEKVAGLLGIREVFSAQMAEALSVPLTKAYARLCESGARASVGEVG
jgi:fructuronate reductase